MRVDESGCEWMRVDESGCEWMRVDVSGCEWNTRQQLFSFYFQIVRFRYFNIMSCCSPN